MLCVYIYKSNSFDYIKQFDFIQSTIMELRKRLCIYTRNQKFTFAFDDKLTMQKLACKVNVESDAVFMLSDGTLVDDMEYTKYCHFDVMDLFTFTKNRKYIQQEINRRRNVFYDL